MKDETDNNMESAVMKILELPVHYFLEKAHSGVLITDEADVIRWFNKGLYEHAIGRPEMKFILNKPLNQGLEFLKEFVRNPAYFKYKVLEIIESREVCLGTKFQLADDCHFELNYFPVFKEKECLGAIWQFEPGVYPESVSETEKEGLPCKYFDQIGFFYCVLNHKGEILQYSPSFSRFIGYGRKGLNQKKLSDFCRCGKERLDTLLHDNIYGVVNKIDGFELEITTVEDSRWVKCIVLDKEHDAHGAADLVLFMTDVTAQKELQKELEVAKEIAEKAQIAQQQFLAGMSHDIRTPLNAIIGMTMLMEDTPLNKEQQAHFKVLKNASNLLLDLLKETLDFAKIETGQQEVHEKEFDLAQTTNALVDTFRFKLKGKNVDLYYDIDPGLNFLLISDPLILNQILMNLLANAMKFTAEGKVCIAIQQEKSYGNTVWIHFRVEDTGIGISKKDLKHIFQDFRRVGKESTNYEGSGLGLFIAHKLVELLGGKLEVKSELGEGTTFYFSLPFEKTKKPTHVYKNLKNTDFSVDKNVRLLIVEDNEMNIQYISALLHKKKIPFDLAESGEAAWEKMKEKRYNLVFTDMKLPKMDGLNLVSFMREKPNLNHEVPVVLLSAMTFKSLVDKAKKAGVDDFLSKPFTPKQLLTLVYKYVPTQKKESVLAREQKNRGFEFNEKLDATYLRNFYSGNMSYAKSLFAIFLREIEDEMSELEQVIVQKDWQKFKKLIHQIKPEFSMVGLSEMTTLTQEIYNRLIEKKYEKATSLFGDLKEDLAQKLPLVKAEFKRLKLKGSNSNLPDYSN